VNVEEVEEVWGKVGEGEVGKVEKRAEKIVGGEKRKWDKRVLSRLIFGQ
jgi:hypothetical protein